MALPPFGDVSVTGEEVGYGHAWYVTFEAAAGADDWLGDLPSLRVSAMNRSLASNYKLVEELAAAAAGRGACGTRRAGCAS